MSYEFNRGNIDYFLYLIAKEYKKENRINPEAEIILIGGASMLVNYNFRESITGLDAILRASSTMKDVINKIGDENFLPSGWLNDNFKKTSSYSSKLVECSKFYKKFCQCLTVRTVADEYLLAMKIRSNREYKHDKSDIIGIIKEHIEMEKPLDFAMVENAYYKLYDEKIPSDIGNQVKTLLSSENLEELFYDTMEEEKINKGALLIAEENYKDSITEDNIHSFINAFKNSVQKFD